MIPVPVEIKLTIIHNMYHTVHQQKPRKVQLCHLGRLSLHAEKYFLSKFFKIKLQLQVSIPISLHFLFFPQIFPSWIRIRILNADPDPEGKRNADPDPQP